MILLDLGYIKLFQSHVLVYILYVYIRSIIIELFLHVLLGCTRVFNSIYPCVYTQKEEMTAVKKSTESTRTATCHPFPRKRRSNKRTNKNIKLPSTLPLIFSTHFCGLMGWFLFLFSGGQGGCRGWIGVFPVADQVYKAWIFLRRQPGRLPTRPRSTPRKRGKIRWGPAWETYYYRVFFCCLFQVCVLGATH